MSLAPTQQRCERYSHLCRTYDCVLEGTGTHYLHYSFEEGMIQVSITPREDQLCEQDIEMNVNACFKNLMNPVDE